MLVDETAMKRSLFDFITHTKIQATPTFYEWKCRRASNALNGCERRNSWKGLWEHSMTYRKNEWARQSQWKLQEYQMQKKKERKREMVLKTYLDLTNIKFLLKSK